MLEIKLCFIVSYNLSGLANQNQALRQNFIPKMSVFKSVMQ